MRCKQPSNTGKRKKKTSKKETKRFEFSKIMALVAVFMWLLVNFFGMAMVVFTLDTSPLMYVVPSVDAVVAAIIGFYLWKARAENEIKLQRLYGVDVNVKDDGGVSYSATYTPACDDDEPHYENSNIV